MSDSYFIVQASKFLLINVMAITLGQGHGEVILYIFSDLYTAWREGQKSLRLQMRRKQTKNIVTPDWGDLITLMPQLTCAGTKRDNQQKIFNLNGLTHSFSQAKVRAEHHHSQ